MVSPPIQLQHRPYPKKEEEEEEVSLLMLCLRRIFMQKGEGGCFFGKDSLLFSEETMLGPIYYYC